MIITGYAIDEKGGNFRADFLSNGKETIKKFRILNAILDGFKDSTPEKYDLNIFLVMASNSKYDRFIGGPNNKCLEKLGQYETLLNDVEIETYKAKKRRGIYKKMNSFDKQQNRSIVLELDILRELKHHRKITNVIYDNFIESNHDYRISLDCIDFNLELTGLGESEPNKILQKSFFKIADELLNLIPDGKMLKIDLKTDMLLNEKNKMDENHIFDRVLHDIKCIEPIIFAKSNSYCSFHMDVGEKSKTLYDLRDAHEYTQTDLYERLALLCNTQKGVEYLKKTSFSIFDNFSVSSFRFNDADFKIAEVRNQSIYPSVAEKLIEKATLRKLERIACDKLKKNQLSCQENSILVIQCKDLLFMGNDEYGILTGNCHKKIKARILNAFKKHPGYENILGIILMEEFQADSIFIPNPAITIQASIISKLKLISQII